MGVGWYFAAFVWVIISLVITLFFSDQLQATLAFTVLSYGGLALFSAWVISQGKLKLECLIGTIPDNYRWGPAIILVVGMILYSLSAGWVTNYPIAITWPDAFQEYLNTPLFLSQEEIANPIAYNTLMVVTLVIVAPVIEETFFRMFLFQRLSIKWGTTTGVIVSSLLFGLLHDVGWLGAFVFGVASCALYMHTQTILIPIAVHALNNAVAALWGWWVIQQGWESAFDSDALQTELYIAVILLVISSPIVFGLLGRWWPKSGDSLPYIANSRSST